MNIPKNFEERIKDYPELPRLLSLFEPVEAFERLLELKDTVPVDIYAFYLRGICQTNSRNVPMEMMLQAFEGIDKTLLMDDDEMAAFHAFPEKITIYRGTDFNENPPRLSWSTDYDIARRYEHGQIFKAEIEKNSIIAYFSSNTNEKEIVAHVKENYEIIMS